MMLAASCFDFLDGFTARLLGAYSPVGKELDSLCDVVSFGVLPSMMMFATAPAPWKWICLCLAVFSALRLAKFNVDDRQSTSFLGLATPSSAILTGSIVYFAAARPDSLIAAFATSAWGLPVLAVVLSALLLSEIPFFSLKFKGKLPMALRYFIPFVAGVAIAVPVLRLNWSAAIILIFLGYIIENLFLCIVRKK